MRIAVISRHSRKSARARGGPGGDRRGGSRTRSGASATSSGTARGRTSASRLVRERTDVCLAGNHDLVVLGEVDLAAFAGEAGRGGGLDAGRARRRRRRRFLAALEPRGDGARASSSSTAAPRDPVWEYVLDDVGGARDARGDERAARARRAQPRGARDLGRTARCAAVRRRPGTGSISTPARRILNPGSVGQPRDGDPRAAWLVIDAAAHRATFRRTDYPIGRTQSEMRERDLPESLSERLAHGA